MPRVKTFTDGGDLLPADLNSIQDAYDQLVSNEESARIAADLGEANDRLAADQALDVRLDDIETLQSYTVPQFATATGVEGFHGGWNPFMPGTTDDAPIRVKLVGVMVFLDGIAVHSGVASGVMFTVDPLALPDRAWRFPVVTSAGILTLTINSAGTASISANCDSVELAGVCWRTD